MVVGPTTPILVSKEKITWYNERQGGAKIYERIDRCFTNNITSVQCLILITLLPCYKSDHMPILIVSDSRANTPKPLFRF
ncbi:unnamed protein product [Spirodela intermedia]|uniref:Uncharacterized protein n=1 Tax=Spirodela intermedia TaxID=51605 RepID=A0A7I8LG61_SPIIN|nr:unnamed protein product [Spirodela intermedia]